jgi:hypothetical protein
MDDEGNSKFDTLETISSNYFKNGFIIDFLTFLPLGYFFMRVDNKLKILWAIKALRIRTLNRQMSDKVLMPIIQSFIEK